MYHLEITTKAIKETFASHEITQIHREIDKILKLVSITYESNMLIKVRQLQNKYKLLKGNDFTIWNIQDSIIKIYKS